MFVCQWNKKLILSYAVENRKDLALMECKSVNLHRKEIS